MGVPGEFLEVLVPRKESDPRRCLVGAKKGGVKGEMLKARKGLLALRNYQKDEKGGEGGGRG